MLQERTYTISEVTREVGGGGNTRQSIQRKLQRRGITFTIAGRGENTTFTITHIPDPFALFCMSELDFAPNTDFTKVRNLFYYFFNDEEFSALPDEAKEARLREEGHPVSRQTIASYLRRLYSKDWLLRGTEYIYYFAHGTTNRSSNREEYLEAWHQYWQDKALYDDVGYACAMILKKYGGFPRKQAIPEQNAITQPQIQQLIELTNKSFEEAYGAD